MALDVATLALCAAELEAALRDARVDKVFQPTRDEVILSLRSRVQSFRLLLSARTGSARVCLTGETYENPAVPPSFCMLLRKHLLGGRLLRVRPVPGDRIVLFDFMCTNEMGDLVHNTLAAELMGRYCNLVLVGYSKGEQDRRFTADEIEKHVASLTGGDMEGRRITDALKRVDFEDSAVRQLLPGLPYTLPPQPEKPQLLEAPFGEIAALVTADERPVSDALRRAVGGVGPVIVREVCFRAFGGVDRAANTLTEGELAALEKAVGALRADYEAGGVPNLVLNPEGLPVEFSFTHLTQYGESYRTVEFESFSQMLEGYYAEKDRVERLRQKSKELRRAVQNMYERALRKQAARKEELAESESSEHLREAGELLTANLHAFAKGDTKVTVQNWYREGAEETIKLDPRLGASANAQKYFREYKKKQTAARMLAELLESGEKEIEYLSTVLYEVEQARGEAELGEIRAELKSQGYLRYYKQRDKKQKPADFMRFTSSDGFLILVGRNNAQNDRLTMKTARGKDLWFHTKNAPGSHVVVMSEGQDIPLDTQNQAAMLAVWFSSQRNSAKIPVDYTQVKNIRKTSDLPPGMVLYEHYETGYVTPDMAVLNTMGIEA